VKASGSAANTSLVLATDLDFSNSTSARSVRACCHSAMGDAYGDDAVAV